MRALLIIALAACCALCMCGCPPPPTNQPVEATITPNSGGTLRLGEAALSVPSGALTQSTTITMGKSLPGAAVVLRGDETAVSDVYTITQDQEFIQCKGNTRLLLTLPYNAGATGKAASNAQVYAVVNTPDPVRAFGTLQDGTLTLSLGGLFASMDFQVVHNPSMVVSAPATAKLTSYPPWPSRAWLVAYDPSDLLIRVEASMRSGKPDSALTPADFDTHIRVPVANAAIAAGTYFESTGYRHPNVPVISIGGVATGMIVHATVLSGSHYAGGFVANLGNIVGQLYIDLATAGTAERMAEVMTHEMFHAIVGGYDLEGAPSGGSSTFVGHNEGMATVMGHSRAAGAITVRPAAVMLLDRRLGQQDPDARYRNNDFYAYVGKRFAGNSLNYIAGTGTVDGNNNGVLEQLHLWVRSHNPSTAEASYLTYLQGISNSFGPQLGFTLGEIYWDFAKNRAFEHNDESRLRPTETEARFTFVPARFSGGTVVSRTITEEDGMHDVVLPSMPSMSTRAIELIASGIESDLTVMLDTATAVPDTLGNGIRAKVYRTGRDGVEIHYGSAETTLDDFGVGTFTHAYVVVSNLSDEKAIAPTFAIITDPADDEGLGGVSGRVTDAEAGSPIGGAAIVASTGASTATDGNGQFVFTALPAGRHTITVAADGYVGVSQSIDVLPDETVQVAVTLMVRNTGVPAGNASGTIVDAVTGAPIPGVTIVFSTGILQPDEGDAPTSGTVTTDASGQYAVNDYAAGTYTGFMTADGYEDGTLVFFIVGGETSANQDGQLSPELNEEEVRIVLTWGADPRDLDSHLTAPSPDAGRFHLYYSNRGIHPYREYYNLDLDDTSSYGPETTTIYQWMDGTYRFSVHDYSNRFSTDSAAMSNSGAQVQVITATETRTFHVSPGRPGTVWTVFEMDGTTGAINPVNQYMFESNPANAASFKVVGADPSTVFMVPDK